MPSPLLAQKTPSVNGKSVKDKPPTMALCTVHGKQNEKGHVGCASACLHLPAVAGRHLPADGGRHSTQGEGGIFPISS